MSDMREAPLLKADRGYSCASPVTGVAGNVTHLRLVSSRCGVTIMAFIDTRSSTAAPMGATVILQAVNAVERALEAAAHIVRVAQTRRRTRAQLARLTSRQLSDIGLADMDINDVVERRIR